MLASDTVSMPCPKHCSTDAVVAPFTLHAEPAAIAPWSHPADDAVLEPPWVEAPCALQSAYEAVLAEAPFAAPHSDDAVVFFIECAEHPEFDEATDAVEAAEVCLS